MKVVLASGNRGKLKELSALLATSDFDFVSQIDLGILPAEETGLTFVENALQKARHASALSGLPAIADDSGIAADALLGAPGIYSARYAGEPEGDSRNSDPRSQDIRNNDKLINALSEYPNKSVHYTCVIVFITHPQDPAPIIATGRWDGTFVDKPRGDFGFGYDAHFFIESLGLTAAELDPTQKNRLSHRGQAVRRLKEELQGLVSDE